MLAISSSQGLQERGPTWVASQWSITARSAEPGWREPALEPPLQQIATLLALQTGLAMLGRLAEEVDNMIIATAISLWSLVANLMLLLTPLEAIAQWTAESPPPTGEDSSRPTVTLTAQEAYKIELNARKVVAHYCQARREGKSSAAAFDRVLSRVQYVAGIPKTTQQTRIFDYLNSEIAKCGTIPNAAALKLSCTSLTQSQMTQIASGKFVQTWGGNCLMIFNGYR